MGYGKRKWRIGILASTATALQYLQNRYKIVSQCWTYRTHLSKSQRVSIIIIRTIYNTIKMENGDKIKIPEIVYHSISDSDSIQGRGDRPVNTLVPFIGVFRLLGNMYTYSDIPCKLW
jgi:hypothetical protein